MTTVVDNNYAIKASNLSKRYDDLLAVDDISFKVREGEIFGFLGPNGAGKTTTIDMLTGLTKITAGKIEVNGNTVMKDIQKSIGVVPSENNLYPELTGFENLCFAASLYGMQKKSRRAKAVELLNTFGLSTDADRSFGAYSKGMQRKLIMAAGIIHDPDILFLDEPTTGIDVGSARQIRRLVANLNTAGTTVFLTTHYIEEAERLCDRVAFLVEGEIAHVDKTERLLEDASGDEIIEFVPDEVCWKRKDDIKEKLAEYEVEFRKSRILVQVSKQTQIKRFVDLFAEMDCKIYEARLVRPSLEDIFVRITGLDLKEMENEVERGRE